MTGLILCPTRGGKASYPNQDRAIKLAQERNADILFLYITDVKFLGMTASPKVVDIEAELDEMGDFLLAMAKERAQKAGVKAITTVRRGVFRKVLKNVILEHPVETIMMGSSSKRAGVTTLPYIQKLAEEISAQTEVEFIVLDEGEIIKTYLPEKKGDDE
jgi:nucleotide-binding universal stress UspA family protein